MSVMDEANYQNFLKELVGHSIVDITIDSLTLDNGVILSIEDSDECCAHYSGEFAQEGKIPSNVITSISMNENEHCTVGSKEAFVLHIIAADEKIAKLSVIGDMGSGYYVRSILFTVTKLKPCKSNPYWDYLHNAAKERKIFL